jgi:hypothetical protein
MAVLSLVMGLLGLVGILPLIGSILAIIFASIARNDMARNPNQSGQGLAQGGMILGIIGLVLWALALLFILLMFVFFTGAFWWWIEAFL